MFIKLCRNYEVLDYNSLPYYNNVSPSEGKGTMTNNLSRIAYYGASFFALAYGIMFLITFWQFYATNDNTMFVCCAVSGIVTFACYFVRQINK